MSLLFLETLGLTANEANIYQFLLTKGEIPAGDIIKHLKLKRATAYKSLYSLEKKGLVSQQNAHKITRFKPESPNNLLALAEQQLKKQERARDDLRSYIPEFISSYILAVEKPVVSIFEGVKGLKEIYEDTLRDGKTIYAALLPLEIDPELLEYLKKSYRVRRAKAHIHAYVLAASNKFATEYKQYDKKYERTTIIIPGSKFPFQHEINIYGSKVAFIHYKLGEPLIGVVINHPQIAKTMKALWDMAWEGAQALYLKKEVTNTSRTTEAHSA